MIYNFGIKVWNHYDKVYQLIARVKNVTVKNKTRSNDFVNIGKPLETIIAQWESLLDEYSQSKNLSEVQQIIINWTGDWILVTQVKKIVHNWSIVVFLVEIKNWYRCLTNIILKLENTSCGIMDI